MKNKNIKFLLGIDGGGTKTEFLLTDLYGSEVRRCILGSSNPVNIGMENTIKVLRDGIEKTCEGIDCNRIAVCAGLAGAGTGKNYQHINNFLSELGFGKFSCSSDTALAIELALNDSDGTVIIMGTGIVALSRKSEYIHRIGGWGYMIDDGGSGYCLGSAALNAAFKFVDGRGGSRTIAEIIEKKLNKSLSEAVSDIYKYGPSYVASFSSAVFEAYESGDTTAHCIIDENAKAVAEIINTALEYDENNKVIICGGLCKQKDILYPFIKKHIKLNADIIFNDEPMVNGAISLAKKLTGEGL